MLCEELKLSFSIRSIQVGFRSNHRSLQKRRKFYSIQHKHFEINDCKVVIVFLEFYNIQSMQVGIEHAL